jgi:mRNA interferase MazF
MNPQRGDVILCQVPMPSTGLQHSKLRPAVVVSKDQNNRRLADVVVAPCTSNLRRQGEPTQYLITGSDIAAAGIRVPSAVKCETLFTMPKALIARRLGRLPLSGMQVIDDCLRNALSL